MLVVVVVVVVVVALFGCVSNRMSGYQDSQRRRSDTCDELVYDFGLSFSARFKVSFGHNGEVIYP